MDQVDNQNLKFEIKNCYDSHTHFVATGQVDLGLKLHSVRGPQDLAHIKTNSEHFRGDWLTGFGWDENSWCESIDLITLDQYFPEVPVFFSRVDGHSSIINSAAISVLQKENFNFNLFECVKDGNGKLTGLLKESAHIAVQLMLPAYNQAQMEKFCKSAIKLYNLAGFTHVRDLSMTAQVAALLHELYQSGQLSLCIEGFVTAESVNDLERAYADYEKCSRFNNPHLRMKGLKIFIDGSLGSETAALSENYNGQSHQGHMSWNSKELETALQFCWTRKIQLAAHVLGDRASQVIVDCARDVSAQGLSGELHLEHVEVLKSETIQKMKSLHITCHMQPCHWLTDRTWLSQKLPASLQSALFPWESLRKNKIKLFFGNDSPIEPLGVFRNQQALALSSKNNIPELSDKWLHYHSHTDLKWIQGRSVFQDNAVKAVFFNGIQII